MDYLFFSAKLLVGVLYILFYVVFLHSWVLSLFYRSMASQWRNGILREVMVVFISCGLLLSPLCIPGFLSIVRLFYAVMSVILILKLLSYLRERGWDTRPPGTRQDFFDFMRGYTINYTERHEAMEQDEVAPSARMLKIRGGIKYAAVGVAIALNATLGLWRYAPPLAATAVKVLLGVLALHATQDVLRARLVEKGLKPDYVFVDPRLFWSRTYEVCLFRTNPIAYRWLLRYVYLPLGGKRHPVRNIMAGYLVCGLVHEYMLSIASMKVSGLWFAYFALSGIIVCAESLLRQRRERLFERLGRDSLACKAAEGAISLVNISVYFCLAHLVFLGFDQVVRFH